jgi:type 1 fimbria pilin
MKKQMILSLMILLLSAMTSVAQSVTDIRKVDFLNFTYNPTQCSQEYGRQGIGRMVKVKDGEFKNKSVYFSVVGDKIVYADLTGDGKEEAIVPIDCGAVGANFSRSEVNVFTTQNGAATLLAATNDKSMERDYRASYPDSDGYWGINENGIKVNDGNLQIDVLVDGPHAAPKYIATLEYGLTGKVLKLKGKPARRNAG